MKLPCFSEFFSYEHTLPYGITLIEPIIVIIILRFSKTNIFRKYIFSTLSIPNLPCPNKIVLGYKSTPVLHQQKKCISSLKIIICMMHKSQNLSKYSLNIIRYFSLRSQLGTQYLTAMMQAGCSSD